MIIQYAGLIFGSLYEVLRFRLRSWNWTRKYPGFWDVPCLHYQSWVFPRTSLWYTPFRYRKFRWAWDVYPQDSPSPFPALTLFEVSAVSSLLKTPCRIRWLESKSWNAMMQWVRRRKGNRCFLVYARAAAALDLGYWHITLIAIVAPTWLLCAYSSLFSSLLV